MPTFNIPGQNLQAGVEWQSSGQPVPAGVVEGKAQITDPNNRWDTTVGNVTYWGLQYSTDNGQSWQWTPARQNGLPFGSHIRGGGLPTIISNQEMTNGLVAAGGLVRLVIMVDTDIRLGFDITTTP